MRLKLGASSQQRGNTRTLLRVAIQSTCSITLLLSLLIRSADAGSDAPREFRDDILPASQLQGELVPGLGRVMLLDTYMRPTSTESMATQFSIFTPETSVIDIRFKAANDDDEGRPHYHYDLDTIKLSGFNITKRTVVMIPGYMSRVEENWARDARLKLLELYEDGVNVVVVSWSDSNRGLYSQAVANTVLVARQVTIFLHYLAELNGHRVTDPEMLNNFHLIGHSLGAHICGFVGQDLGGRVGRITGLDPAGPSFDGFPRERRLDRTDAKLVEVLHTNGGRLRYLGAFASAVASLFSGGGGPSSELHDGSDYDAWFGIDSQIGHIDYYANNGRTQRGCNDRLHICDHKRAGNIYVEILQYESALRKLKETKQKVQRRRLMAFKAENFDSFQVGANFAHFCPQVMTVQQHLTLHELDRPFSNCAIPLMDFMKPVDDLVKELRDEYQVNFDPEAAPEEQPRYYFKTGDRVGNLMSDHYLLRVYLSEPRGWLGDNSCSLQVQLIMADGEKVTLDINMLEHYIHQADGHELLAIPFTHPSGLKAHLQLAALQCKLQAGELQQGGKEEQQQEQQEQPNQEQPEQTNATVRARQKASPEFTRLFRNLFPKIVILNVKRSAEFSSSPELTCRLSMHGIEVHPLNGYAQNLGAIYGRNLFLGDRVGLVNTRQFADRIFVFSMAHKLLVPVLRQRSTILISSDTPMSSVATGIESALVA